MLEFAAGSALVTVDPEAGGRIVGCRIDGHELLTAHDRGGDPMLGGCFPMVPFAGRIRRGRFSFDGAELQLPIGLPPHAIHGFGYLRPWEVIGPTELRCEFGPDWAFGGHATQRFELTERQLVCRMAVHAGERPMPAQLGWHPWFVKPDEVGFAAAAMYRRDDDGIAVEELVTPPAGPWDDAFVGVVQPVTVRWGELVVELRSDCPLWVVYDRQADATCIEPSTGPPDGFNLGPLVLAPGDRLERSFIWRW